MISERDRIYYDWLFDKKEPKKLRWKLYCRFRNMITIEESSSKIAIWISEQYIEGFKKGVDKIWKE